MVKKIIAMIMLCSVLASTAISVSACDGSENSASLCMITYDLNYDDAGIKQMTIKSGQRVREWRAYREGYELIGWFTDAECGNAFDFSKGVTGDCTLYADWIPQKGYAEVTFDFDYIGRVNKTVALKTNQCIKSAAFPDTERMGMIFTGWYKDKAKTQLWDSENEVVTADMTLYAGYEIDRGWVTRNEDGSVKYENEVIDVWCESPSDIDYDIFVEIVNEFNELHKGEIEVKPSRDWTWDVQYKAACRSKATKSLLTNAWSNNYNVVDLFSVAGIDFDFSEFYENGIEDTFMNGLMKVFPFAAKVPFAIYNKALMKEYWGCIGNKLPANYTELQTLLKAVYEGENESTQNFAPLIQSTWFFKESTALLPFVQNGVDYFKYSSDYATGLYNDWKEAEVNENLKRAMEISYDLFGTNGSCHANVDAQTIIDDVIAGKALLGIVGMSTGSIVQRVIENSQNIGFISLSGLFSEDADAQSKSIPIYTLGVGFYNGASNCTNSQLCASAEFAKYLSDHSYKFASAGLVPLNKKSYAEFEKDDSESAELLRQVASPENFYTFTGAKYQSAIMSDVVAESLISFFGGDGTNVDDAIEKIRLGILAKLN